MHPFKSSLRTFLLSCTAAVLLSFPCGQAHAQEAAMPDVKYLRPCVTTMLVATNDSLKEKVYAAFATLPVPDKFDDHSIGFPRLSLDGATEDPMRASVLTGKITPYARDIVAKWFNRDPAGGMDVDLIMARGDYSEDDALKIVQRASAVDRSGAQGWDLLGKSYVVVYEITEVARTGSETKNQKTGKVTKTEGFRVRYKADVYKLMWNDSVEFQFTQRYWNPRSNPDPQRAEAWSSAAFQVTKVAQVNDKVEKSRTKQDKNEPALLDLLAGKDAQGPVEGMLPGFAEEIQKAVVRKFSKLIGDMRPRASIVSEYPITAKLGTKESLKPDHRFVAYELQQTKSGEVRKVRKGVVRVTKVAQNKSVATGESPVSTFQQQGGQQLYQGTLLEERHDLGINISGGWTMADELMGGASASFKGNLGRFVDLPGLYFGMNLSVPVARDMDASGLASPRSYEGLYSNSDLFQPGKWRGSGTVFTLLLSKEMYFTRKGHIYIEPTLGYGWAWFSFGGNGNTTFNNNNFPGGNWTDNAKKSFSYKANVISIGSGVGFHFFGTMFALEARPMINFRTAYRYSEDSMTGNVTWEGDQGLLTSKASDLARSFRSRLVPSAMLAIKVRL